MTELPTTARPTTVATERSLLSVSECYRSIQGEGLHAGQVCVFVRLAGCDLRCSYCDSAYTWDGTSPAKIYSVGDVAAAIAEFGCRLVEITGGEPLLQPKIFPLMSFLCDGGYDVILETGGQIDARAVDHRVTRIIDLKTPGSAMDHRNFTGNMGSLRPTDEIKFVLVDREDYDWAKGRIVDYEIAEQVSHIWLSPAHSQLKPSDLAGWMIDDNLNASLQLQVHKYLWPDSTRGV